MSAASASEASDAPPSLGRRISAYAVLHLLTLSVLSLDYGTKWWVENNPRLNPIPVYWTPEMPGEGYELIPNWLYLCHVGNHGAAFSMLQGFGDVLAGLALVAVAVIFFCRKSLQLKRPIFQWTFGLLVGGILGNFIDRVRLGHVTDFIDVHLPGYRWPAFNVADSAICVGVALYIILSFREPEPAK